MFNKARTKVSLAFQPRSLNWVTMYDSIYPGNLPGGAAAYAGYVNGAWPTYSTLVSKYEASGAKLLSIDVFGNATLAHCLDVESGDATNADVLPWFKRMKAAGVPVPVIYTSASNAGAVISILLGAGYTRQQFLVWSAHYTFSSHICAPSSCGYPAADATQWSDAGPNNCDVSSMASYFFPWTLGESAPPAPVPNPGPQPYPAPANLKDAGHSVQVALTWDEVAVSGKPVASYTVQVVELNGTVAQQFTTLASGCVVSSLTEGWQYKVRVWANGGPVAPPHAELDITA